MIGAAKENLQFTIKTRLALGQSSQFALNATVPLDDFAGIFEDQRLRGMKPPEIRGTSGSVGQLDPEHGFRALKLLARLVEKGCCLRLHRSMPSVRIACIRGIRGSL